MTETHASEVDAARAALLAAGEARKRGAHVPRTKVAKIRALREEIAALRAQGFTWSEIADALDGTLKVSADTLRLAIGTKTTASRKRQARPGKAEGASSATSAVEHVRDTAPPVVPIANRHSAVPKERFGPPEL